MIRINNHKQQELFDPWRFLSPKRRSLLEQSWPGLFKSEILTELPVGKLASFFNHGFGRPTKELYTVLGVLVLQQTFDLTDEETVDQFAFNIQWHYALDITEESDSAKYMCPKTLWNMRSILVENSLDLILFEQITRKLADVFKVNTDNQRIDSVHIKSNMRRLGRIGIFVSGINRFLKNLKRHYKEQFETIRTDMVEKYLPAKALGCFSMVKPSEARNTLSMVSNDLFDLVQQFKDHPGVTGMHSYKLLERILKEQCNLTVAGETSRIEVKAPKEVPSDSLQNPSDPDATYSGHKGQGYQVQIMETYSGVDDKETRSKTLNLITHVEVEQAHESDANALIPAIESAGKNGLTPKKALADSLYGSDENCQEAEQLGVEVIAPAMGDTKETAISLSDFQVSENLRVISCPQGHEPVIVKKRKNRYSVAFNLTDCNACPNQTQCPVRKGKRYYYLRYTEKQMRIAMRRAYEQTEAFKDRYRWRAGVEATMSEYDRRTGVKRLRVRGFKAVRFCATLKALGINILRAAAVQIAVNPDPNDGKQGKASLNHAFYIVKERFLVTWRCLKKIFRKITPQNEHNFAISKL